MALLELKHVTVRYTTKSKNITAVNDVSLDVEDGDSLGIVGESGSGKTTLAMSIPNLFPHKGVKIEGEIKFNGADLITMNQEKMAELRWKEIAVVFQKSMNALSPVHKIGVQLSDVYRVHIPRGVSDREVRTELIELLNLVNLPPKVYDMYPHELSGGMMQRVSIALSLIFNPKLLILDEATTALDAVTQTQILREIMDLGDRLGITRIMVTHDLSVVSFACNKIAVMYAGTIVETGRVHDVLTNPQHPYTQGLLKSIPQFYGEKRMIRGLPGSVPDLAIARQGCVFADRCDQVAEKCRKETPVSTVLPDQRSVKCHLIGGGIGA